jgi:flagellar hook-basal body complex protein FliE
VAAIEGIGAAAAANIGQDRGSIRIGMGGEGGESFADALQDALGSASQLQTDAKDAIGAFLRGEPIEIHEVMAATEEAGIALEMLIEIRNKLTDAYRAVIQMQQ